MKTEAKSFKGREVPKRAAAAAANAKHKKASIKATVSSSSSTSGEKKKSSWDKDTTEWTVKRFADGDAVLTDGAKRDRAIKPYAALAELDPSGRSSCQMCRKTIPKGILRVSLMLECHIGYRNPFKFHEECFWKQGDTKKLDWNDIHFSDKVGSDRKRTFEEEFEAFSKQPK